MFTLIKKQGGHPQQFDILLAHQQSMLIFATIARLDHPKSALEPSHAGVTAFFQVTLPR